MEYKKSDILVIGATGLLGNMVFRLLSERGDFNLFGTVRKESAINYFSPGLRDRLIVVKDLTSLKELQELLGTIKPDVVINCVSAARPMPSKIEVLIPLLSLLPMRLSYLCAEFDARLIHISSDGVFSGKRGAYCEDDTPDAQDAYGIAKQLGEVKGGALTLRTSILGPELESKFGLLEWFLSQSDECMGCTGSIFSGVTSLELAKCIRDVIIPNPNLIGVLHVASTPCSKFDLLSMIKSVYGLELSIKPDDSLQINRSLSGEKLKKMTAYSPPKWVSMLNSMRNYKFGLD